MALPTGLHGVQDSATAHLWRAAEEHEVHDPPTNLEERAFRIFGQICVVKAWAEQIDHHPCLRQWEVLDEISDDKELQKLRDRVSEVLRQLAEDAKSYPPCC